MGVILHLHCEEDKLSRVEITKSLDINFLDHDIEYDIAFDAMGGSPSLCYQAYKEWQDNPLGFILGSGLIPVLHLGVVSCGLVRKAIPIVESATKADSVTPSCLRPAMGLAGICERQLKQFRRDISKLHHWKQDLVHAWNDRVSGAQKRTNPPSFGEDKLVDAALECYAMVMGYWDLQEQNKSWTKPPAQSYTIAELVRNSIASATYKHVHDHPDGIKGLLTVMTPEFAEELIRISRMEAGWAVEILEGIR